MNRKLAYLALFLNLVMAPVHGQVTISPEIATADDEITITYDATKGTTGLVGLDRVFMHAGALVDGSTDTGWDYVIGDWGDPNSPGEMTKIGTDLWEITITPRDYFAPAGLSADETVFRLGLVFREAGPCSSCKEGKTNSNGDFFIDLRALDVRFNSPGENPKFLDPDQSELVLITATEPCSLKLYQDGVLQSSSPSGTQLQKTFSSDVSGTYTFRAVAELNGDIVETTTQIVVRGATTIVEDRPTGIIDGINYSADPTQVTLSLQAPQKSMVYVTGDFNDWSVSSEYLMKKDGEHFWITLTGLEPGIEYAYQYLVDEEIFIADPYADKILDYEDRGIPETTYPNLKEFPSEASRGKWYKSVASTFQTGQEEYQWQVPNFTAPAKNDLVIYELLIRDFFGRGEQNYQNLIDTLGYFKRLGINAIELMPIMEFNGNESWGYNPTFMFAPDKFYGSKNDLKAFIDAAHAEGIAIILDIALNHQDQPNPYVIMYWDDINSRPASNSPWFNPVPKHPFNVFFDMNHESTYTQQYLDTINHYWLNEYKVDGFRFDLSKGFTQKQSSDDGVFRLYDASRIQLLKRMSSEIWKSNPNAYVILEHFAENSEEKELADYGMMLWGNTNFNSAQLLMGYSDQSNISGTFHKSRNWNNPHLVAYMESHDEQRIMVKSYWYGNSNNDYSTVDQTTALHRLKALSAIFYTIPGPKMLWQFGEFGYDVPLGDGLKKLEIKPTKWEYLEQPNHRNLQETVAEIIRLKTTYPIFETSDVTLTNQDNLSQKVILKANPFTNSPSNPDEMSVVVIANFDIIEKNMAVEFPHIGTWYNHFTGSTYEVTSSTMGIQLNPGEFRLFTNYQLTKPDIILSNHEENLQPAFKVFPNPANNQIFLEIPRNNTPLTLQVFNLNGQLKTSAILNPHTPEWDVSALAEGLYIIFIPELGLQTKLIINR